MLHVLLAKFGHDGPKLPAVIDSAVRFIEPAEIRPDALFEGPEIPWMGLEVQGDKDEDKHRSAISVGAFKLFGGGSTKQGAGIVVGSLDIGGETARSETMLREAGKVEGCNSTSDQSPHAEEQWADKGVQVALEAPEDTVSWSLHDKQGAFVCKLPCSRWLGPSSEYFVRRNEVKASGFEDIPVPELACGDQ